MRLEINLATNPYEDARAFYKRAGVALAAVLVLTMILAVILFRETSSSRHINAQISAIHAEMNSLQQQEAQARAILALPENQGTRDQSKFINSLLAQRAFSWTDVFADLEHIMPTRVRVLSINPKLTSQNQIQIKIIVGGDSREKAIELLHNLEKSKHFREPQLAAEQTLQPQANNPDTVQFNLSALYVPSVQPTEAAPAAKSPKNTAISEARER